MSTRVQRNTTNIGSIGFQCAVDTGRDLKVEYILTMVHPHHQDFPHTYSQFKDYVTKKLLTPGTNVKLVCVRDNANNRNILIGDETDYDIMCNTERKEYHRMPVFTIVVTLDTLPKTSGPPTSPPTVQP